MEQAHSIATNLAYIVPLAMVVTACWIYFQRTRLKNPVKGVISNNFILRNSLFVGVVVFTVVYFSKPIHSLEESIIVKPADF